MKRTLLLAFVVGSSIIGIGCQNNKQENYRDQSLSSGLNAKIFTITLVLGGASHGDSMMIQCTINGSPNAQTKINAAKELFELIRPTCEALRLGKGEVYISKNQSSQGNFDSVVFSRNPNSGLWEPEESKGFSIEGPTIKQ